MSASQIELNYDINRLLSHCGQLDKLNQYYDLLKSENQKVNLVSRETIDTGLDKLTAESLLPLDMIEGREFDNHLDIGSGGGFPAIPLHLSIAINSTTLVERINKKATALERIIEGLDLSSKISVLPRNFEEIKFKKQFDLITIRQVKLSESFFTKIFRNLQKTGHLFYYSTPEFSLKKYQAHSVTGSYSISPESFNKTVTVITKK